MKRAATIALVAIGAFLALAAAAPALAQTAERGAVTDRLTQPMLGARNVGEPVPGDDACWRVLAVEVVRTSAGGNARCVSTKAATYAFLPAPPVEEPPPLPAGLPEPMVNGCPPSTIPATAQGTWLMARGATCPATRFAGAREFPSTRVAITTAPGTGPLATIEAFGGMAAVEFGGYAMGLPHDTTRNAGVLLRDFKVKGNGTQWGVWVKGDTRDVRIEGVEATGFDIGVHWQGTEATTGSALVRSNLSDNRVHGLLGTPLLVEGNTFGRNNLAGVNGAHGAYMGSSGFVSRKVVVRGNTFTDNSRPNGTGACTGGNLTMHGRFDGLLVEDNRITQSVMAAGGCWGISITPAYGRLGAPEAESFLGVVVRGNLIDRLGLPIGYGSAPGILIERNRLKRSAFGYAITPGAIAPAELDAADGGAVVRDNEVCGTKPGSSAALDVVSNPGLVATNSGNAVSAVCLAD